MSLSTVPERKKVNGFGERIRERREDQQLTLRALAAKVGLSASFLAQVEHGYANPSIESLQLIANALNVPIFYFFTAERTVDRVVHEATRRRLHLPDSNITYELLHPTLSHKSLGLVIRIGPGDQIHPIHLSEPTEEWLLLLQGQVIVEIAGSQYRMEPGDSITYEGWELQGVASIGEREAVLVGGMTPPAF